MMEPLYITDDVRRMLWGYVDHVTTEIGGLGYCRADVYGNYVWDDIFLLPQEVSGGSVEFDDSWVEYAITRAAEDDVLGHAGFSWVSWHSHGNLGVSWSATDEEMIEKFGSTGIPHVWSVVGNRDHSVKVRLDLFQVKHAEVEIPHIKFETGIKLVEYLTDEHLERVDAEVKALVRLKPVKSYPTRAGTVKGTKSSDPGDKLEKSLAKRDGDASTRDTFDKMAWQDDDIEALGNAWMMTPDGTIYMVDAEGEVIPETMFTTEGANS